MDKKYETLCLRKLKELEKALTDAGIYDIYNTDNKYYVNDPTMEYGYMCTDLRQIAKNLAQDNLYVLHVEPGFTITAHIDLAQSLDDIIAESAYEILKDSPTQELIDYAFYEGHITFKQYNELYQKVKGVK